MTIAQLIDMLEDFDQDAQVLGDDGTRFVTVEKSDVIKHTDVVYIHTWRNIDHEEYLKDEVDTIMSVCHGHPEENIMKMVIANLSKQQVDRELYVDDRFFLHKYIREKVDKEQKTINIRELEGYKEHLRDLIKQCDNKIAELTKGQNDES